MISKEVLIGMLDTHWVTDAMDVSPMGDKVQIALVPRTRYERGKDRNASEPFPGLTEEIKSFVQSDRVIAILGAVINTERKVMNILVTLPESAHTEEDQ